jgi:hypothetical protein
MPGVDWKGVGLYLGLVFGIGYAAQAVLLLTGILDFGSTSLFTLAGEIFLFLIPGLCAVIARPRAPLAAGYESSLWPFPQWAALRIIFVVPAVFLVSNLICVALGWTTPDWNLTPLMAEITPYIERSSPGFSQSSGMAMMPAAMMVSGLVLAAVTGMTVFTAIALGTEYGWRGYLLPKLLPMGKVRALLLTGLAFALWYAPLVVHWHTLGQGAPMYLFPDMLHFVIMSLVFGAVLGGIWLRTRHIGLVALALGTWVGHEFLVWEHLFNATHRIIEGPFKNVYYTGNWGLVAMGCWLVIALVPAIIVPRTVAKD